MGAWKKMIRVIRNHALVKVRSLGPAQAFRDQLATVATQADWQQPPPAGDPFSIRNNEKEEPKNAYVYGLRSFTLHHRCLVAPPSQSS